MLQQSVCLSADVNVALDPIYPDTVEPRNCAWLNRGVVLTKYTGSRGKSDTSDASAELMGRIRSLMDGAAWSGRSASWARWIWAAAEPWRNISPTWMWTRWYGRAGAEYARAF